MASSHANHGHLQRYPPHPNSNPPPHVPSNDVRLPPLKSLNFPYRPLQQDAHPAPDQPAYAVEVSQDVNPSTPTPAASPHAPNGTSYSSFGYPTPTPTSAPAYVHRQPFAYQGQPSSQSQQHDHDASTWQQQHPHAANPSTSTHSQTPSQVHAQVPASQTSSFARTTPLVPTTVDPPPAAPPRTAPAFPAPPKHRSSYPPQSPYTPNTSHNHSYHSSYTPSSATTSAPYTPFNTSPGYANTTSPTFSPSTTPSYPSGPHANTAPSYSHNNPYPTPTSAYPHPPPSPTPTPTQPLQPSAHASPHYVPPPTSAVTYGFDDNRSGTTYDTQGPAHPVRGNPQAQETRDSRVSIPDRARYPNTQPKLADARIDSRHEMYPHPPAPTSVPASATIDARHSHSYPQQHENRPVYSHQGDSSRPGTSYTQAQPQTHSEVARTLPPEPRTGTYTQDSKYTYSLSHAPDPPSRAGGGYVQDRIAYLAEGPTRHPQAQDSRASYPHAQESHGSNRATAPPYITETRQPSGYMPAQDARHGYSSEPSALPSSYVPAEPRHGPPGTQYVPSNASQRSSFGDSRPAAAYPVCNDGTSRNGYTASDSVTVPAIVPSQSAPPPHPLSSQHQLARQNGQPHNFSSNLSSYPQHAASSYSSSPTSNSQHASNIASHPHPQSHSYIPPQPTTHGSHSSHLSQSHGAQPSVHPSVQAVHSTHPTQAQATHSLSHSQSQQQMHHPEGPRLAYVSPAETMHAREARLPLSTTSEDERAHEREREREREHERERERERERENQREREREIQREKERERQVELREKEQKERERERGRDGIMREVLDHCKVLYDFATHYAQLQSSTPLVQPSAEELAQMTHRAQEVVRLLESLRSPSSAKLANASAASSSSSTLAAGTAPHSSITSSGFGDRTNSHSVLNPGGSSTGVLIDPDTRAPKRPWEETQTSNALPHVSQLQLSNPSAGVGQVGGQTAAERSAAEKDMEIIRTKRALTTSLAAAAAAAGGTGSVAGAVGGAVGAGKSKYRKRSRATPPGKCHSCNIRETPEWRRGPDGARTLCNACGLHYAKLVRKRDKALAAEGGSATAMRIDMDMLRASARAAESEKAARAAANGPHAGGTTASGSNGSADMDKMSVHTSSFQIVPMTMNVDSDPGPGQGPSQTQTQGQAQSQTQSQAQPSQGQASQSLQNIPPPTTSGTPHIHVLPGQGHPLPSSHAVGAQGNPHFSHSHGSQARTHPGPPPPPWAGKAYGPEMQHPPQSFIRTSHSVSSGASPP